METQLETFLASSKKKKKNKDSNSNGNGNGNGNVNVNSKHDNDAKKKKKNRIKNEDEKYEVDQIVIALASPSQHLKFKIPNRHKQQQQQQQQKPIIKIKTNPQNVKKLEKDDETLTKKRKAENGVEEDNKKEKIKKERRMKKVAVEESSECRFPMNRIVRIIKSEGSDFRLSQESVFLINKASEKFIELFAEDAYDCALQDKKSFVGYKHLSSAVGQAKRLDFLSDFVPEKVSAEKALAEMKPAEKLPG